MNNAYEPVRFEVEQIPDLSTQVAIAGTSSQSEVGGVVCLCVAAGIIICM